MAKKPKETKKDKKTAVLEINNYQYLIQEGQEIPIRIDLSAQKKDIKINVLAIFQNDTFDYGTPYIKKEVDFELGEIVKGKKVVKATYTAKSRYRRKVGHRSKYREFKLKSIK